jgi:hypothetical protein
MPITLDGGAGVTYPDGVQQTNAVTNTGGNPGYYAARAWVNFNGQGAVEIRAAANISSISDNGVGNYTINFTTPMPDVNYVFVGSAWDEARSTANQSSVYERSTVAQRTTGSFRISVTVFNSATYDDALGVYVAVFR